MMVRQVGARGTDRAAMRGATMAPDHTLTVHFDAGDGDVILSLQCHLRGADRRCAVIDCPVDHEDVSQKCIEVHGATARDECWAVAWYEAGGRESMNVEALEPVTIPVTIDFDDGVLVEPWLGGDDVVNKENES